MKRKAILWVLLVLAAAAIVRVPVLAWPGTEALQASSYLVMDAVSGDILVEHNIDERRSIASVTKIVTCMTVLSDPAYDPERLLTASTEGTTLASPESARVGLLSGEQITTKDALTALMVASANEVANTLAENYSGVEGTFEEKLAAFSAKMNAFAAAHGANSSNFNNPSGFDVEGHVSTARDIAILAGYAMQNETFRELVSQPYARLAPTNMHPNADWAIMNNTNWLVRYGADVFDSDYFVRYDGIKTGTTPQAGNCLVASAELPDGGRLIAVMLNAGLVLDGRLVNIAVPVRALLEEGGRVYRETHPFSPTEAPTEAPTAEPTAAPADATSAAAEGAAETASQIPLGTDKSGIDPTLIFVLGGIGLLLAVILFYLLMDMRRRKRQRRRRQALRELREMQDIRDSGRNTPRR